MSIIDFMRWHVSLFLVLLVLVIAYQMLTGRIRLKGLMRDKTTGQLSPGRVQLFAVTLMGAGGYLVKVLTAHSEASLPPVPADLLGAVGASSGIYLLGKFHSAFRDWFSPKSRI
jgi:hypothetical protein